MQKSAWRQISEGKLVRKSDLMCSDEIAKKKEQSDKLKERQQKVNEKQPKPLEKVQMVSKSINIQDKYKIWKETVMILNRPEIQRNRKSGSFWRMIFIVEFDTKE